MALSRKRRRRDSTIPSVPRDRKRKRFTSPSSIIRRRPPGLRALPIGTSSAKATPPSEVSSPQDDAFPSGMEYTSGPRYTSPETMQSNGNDINIVDPVKPSRSRTRDKRPPYVSIPPPKYRIRRPSSLPKRSAKVSRLESLGHEPNKPRLIPAHREVVHTVEFALQPDPALNSTVLHNCIDAQADVNCDAFGQEIEDQDCLMDHDAPAPHAQAALPQRQPVYMPPPLRPVLRLVDYDSDSDSDSAVVDVADVNAAHSPATSHFQQEQVEVPISEETAQLANLASGRTPMTKDTDVDMAANSGSLEVLEVEAAMATMMEDLDINMAEDDNYLLDKQRLSEPAQAPRNLHTAEPASGVLHDRLGDGVEETKIDYRLGGIMSNERLLTSVRPLADSPPDALATKNDIAVVLTYVHDQIENVRSPHKIAPTSDDPRDDHDVPADRSIKHRDADVLASQREIRAHTLAMMGLDTHSKMTWVNVPSPQEVKTFSKNRRGGPSVENFRPDLVGTPSNAWNKRLAEVFADDFITQDHFSCKDREAVLQAFTTHLSVLRSRYRKAANDADEQEKIDAAQVEARVQRQRSLYARRFEACSIHPDLAQFKDLWNQLSYQAMSEDEGDYVNGEFRYVIVNPPWRSSLVTPFLRLFDKIHLSSRFTSTGRPKRGAFPHRRVPSRRVGHSMKPVSGLPRNFYDETWLANLEEFEVDALDVKPERDLSVTNSVVRLGERFRNVVDGTTRPLDRDDPSLPPLHNVQVMG